MTSDYPTENIYDEINMEDIYDEIGTEDTENASVGPVYQLVLPDDTNTANSNQPIRGDDTDTDNTYLQVLPNISNTDV